MNSCVRCILNDSVDKHLSFDSAGLCNHCQRYDELVEQRVFTGTLAEDKLKVMVETIKIAGKGNDYDCIVGVSGGVDSTYVAYLAKKLGLRPLAVHFDNGWNSELAVKNVESVLKTLDIDLYTHVVDWEEFRDLQLSFLKASTPDGEIPTDHAIGALLWRQAVQHRVKYILSGMNFATESISIPDWSYGHSDWRYIRSVHKIFGSRRLKSYPHFNFLYLFYVNFIRGIRTVSILNYVDFRKQEAIELLEKELGWIRYHGKHHESVYTRFYQGYVLPKKFGIDKRYGHLSDLINAGQMTRIDALNEMESEPYPVDMQSQDLTYARKKFGLDEAGFEYLMKSPVRSFREYPNSYTLVQVLRRAVNYLRKHGLYPR